MLAPRNPLFVHELPPAPNFTGRTEELRELGKAWQSGTAGVFALVGLGGAGKTALVAQFLAELKQGELPAPQGLLVFSFYREPDPTAFLDRTTDYFADAPAGSAHGLGRLHQLMEALDAGGPCLLVLDGLERVQESGSAGGECCGRLTDPLLRSLLVRLAEGTGHTMTLVTSRFPLVDLNNGQHAAYHQIDVDRLDRPAAVELLRARGVRGSDEVLGELVDRYGAHALTLDHLGGLISQFFDGDPIRAPQLAEVDTQQDQQGQKLGRLLRAYERHLPAAELALLGKLCLLRRATTREHLVEWLECSPPVTTSHARELYRLLNRCLDYDPAPHENAQREVMLLSEAIADTIAAAVEEATVAGPPKQFKQDVLQVCLDALDPQRADSDVERDIHEVARLYRNAQVVSAEKPLSQHDRFQLREAYGLYADNPFHRTARNCLMFLAAKHNMLVQIDQICHRYQAKWESSGPLAKLNALQLGEVLESLVARHLVLRDEDGTYSVHPAVQDHFRQQASADQANVWHDLIRQHLVSLVRQPGLKYVEDPAGLDVLEEAIHHAIEAGHTDEAEYLYREVLGGHRQLAWKLGEMARGLRILSSFPKCPEPWALAWFQRALGELDAAYESHQLRFFRADVRLLQGRLPEVLDVHDSYCTEIARFLMGQVVKVPYAPLGCAIPAGKLYLYREQWARAAGVSQVDDLCRDYGWEGDRARCLLVLADCALRQNDPQAQRLLLDAGDWILHSGSVEHLAALHLLRARWAHSEGQLPQALRAINDGLHAARTGGLRLLLIELWCEQARLLLSEGNDQSTAAAADIADRALRESQAENCRFAWGAVDAGWLLAQAEFRLGKLSRARDQFEQILHFARTFQHPRCDALRRDLRACLGDV